MAKEVATPQEEILEAAQEQTENFFEKNSKTMVIALVAIFVLAAAVFGYKKLVMEPRMEKAQEMLYEAPLCRIVRIASGRSGSRREVHRQVF